jgi:hypothetical protein
MRRWQCGSLRFGSGSGPNLGSALNHGNTSLDDLQYPHTKAFVMRTLHSLSPFLCSVLNILTHCVHTYSSVSPHMGFPHLNLAAPIAKHTYGSSYTTGSPSHPHIPPHSMYPTALMSLCASSGAMRLTCLRLPAQCIIT